MGIITYRTILFMGSNPSRRSSTDIPFWEDSRSRATLNSWLSQLDLTDCKIEFMNVSDKVTENNRPLKISEIRSELSRLESLISAMRPDKIISLGKTADKALTLLDTPHFAMEHPSGLNRKLNDAVFVAARIRDLNDYLSPSAS